jgi:hypothetical protein
MEPCFRELLDGEMQPSNVRYHGPQELYGHGVRQFRLEELSLSHVTVDQVFQIFLAAGDRAGLEGFALDAGGEVVE